MVLLTPQQIDAKKQFFYNYINSENAATGSKLDANANVSHKNIATLEAEIDKDFKIQYNRSLIVDKIKELENLTDTVEYGDGSSHTCKTYPEFQGLSEQYIKDIESHLIYVHDETSMKPYCVSLNMYPFLQDGMVNLGGDADAPQHLTSFCGNFVNFVFATAAQFAGAVATVEFLLYFDYFARKDYGVDYLKTNYKEVIQQLQGVVYAINQPAAARGYQSVFWNISTYDKYFFEGMFGDFVFPFMTEDGTDFERPNWDTLNELQKEFHIWFRKERTKKLLTFSVVTHAAIVSDDNTTWKDQESREFIADEMSKGGEFFIFTSDSANALSSCCRLKNDIKDNTFSYSLGAGGVATGSINVITINMNRLVQEHGEHELENIIKRVQNYQLAFRKHFEDLQEAKMLSVYDAGFIQLDKQYLTLGVNGLVEAAEYLGYDITNNPEYKQWLQKTLGTFKELNSKKKEETGIMFNTELVPAENLGVKNAKWDKADGLVVPRDCYNSYFYRVEDNLPYIDKMILHGKEIVGYLDGGSAFHDNRSERLDKEHYLTLLDNIVKTGNNYYCENVMKTCCNECGIIVANTYNTCPECGSDNIDYAERVIGYLKKVSSYSLDRQLEQKRRVHN